VTGLPDNGVASYTNIFTDSFSVAPKSYYIDNQYVLKDSRVGLAVNLERARKGNKVQLVLNFSLLNAADGDQIKINERYVHENMRQQGVMKQCSLSLLMQLANKMSGLTVESQSQHLATYKFITGTAEGFPQGPLPSVVVSNTVEKIFENNPKDAAIVREKLQHDYKIKLGDSEPKAGSPRFQKK
jgi:hypothetical protein